MATHKLDLTDLRGDDYCLFAIHSNLEDFRLAHAINSNLKTRLKRLKKDLDVCASQNPSFSLFEWEDPSLKNTWNLLTNYCQVEYHATGQGLFAEREEKIPKKIHLIKEHSKVDYFLKISGSFGPERAALENLKKITAISLVYQVEVEKLESNEYLILN